MLIVDIQPRDWEGLMGLNAMLGENISLYFQYQYIFVIKLNKFRIDQLQWIHLQCYCVNIIVIEGR